MKGTNFFIRTIIFSILILLCNKSFNYGQIITSPANNSVIQFEEGQSVNVTFQFINVFKCDNPQGVFALTIISKIPDNYAYGGGDFLTIGNGMTYNGGQFSDDLIPGSYDIGVILNYKCCAQCDMIDSTYSISITVEKRNRINFTNNFGTGTLKVNEGDVSSGFQDVYISGASLSVTANEPQYSGNPSYKRVWNDTEGPDNKSNWIRRISTGREDPLSENQNYSFSVSGDDHRSTYIANMRKVCDLIFHANSSMYVNGSTRTSPWTESVVEQNSIYASANSYSSNYIDYTFDQWDNNPSSNTITATAHNTYTAVYVGRPTNTGEYASAGGTVGQPIVVTWVDNPNTAVNQFQIWRKVKHNGVVGGEDILTTVGRGVQSYTDYDYVVTNGYTDDIVYYDVRAYYSTEGTYSDPDYTAQFGRLEAEIDNDLSEKNTRSLVVPTEYSITNYPNPFNPTTTINYQLPENGFVTIKVYDMIGKEIVTLVNENKSAGYHRVNFDASKLTSGVYIYTITANNFIQSKKMLLMK